LIGLLVKDQKLRILESLTAIINNPWFERVWTLQEVTFGRKCMVIQGRHTLDWESLCTGYISIPTRGLERRSETERLLSRWRLYLQLRGPSLGAIPPSRFRGFSQAQAELELLTEIRNMKATVPHDKVYSLYALFQAMGLVLPAPDYKKDVVAVFEEAAVSYIRRRQSLGIITLTAPPEGTSRFPSWVPDWLTPGRYTERLIWNLVDFDAKPLTATPRLTEKTGNGKLGVMATSIGRITTLARCPLVGDVGLPQDAVYQEFVNACLDWRRLVEGLDGYPSQKDPVQIQGDLLRKFHHAVPSSVLGPWYRWLLDGCRVMPSLDGECSPLTTWLPLCCQLFTSGIRCRFGRDNREAQASSQLGGVRLGFWLLWCSTSGVRRW
jgi:hypothetical protein